MTSSVGKEAAATRSSWLQEKQLRTAARRKLGGRSEPLFRTKRRNRGGWGLEFGDSSERLSTSTRKQATSSFNSGGNVFKWFKKGSIR